MSLRSEKGRASSPAAENSGAGARSASRPSEAHAGQTQFRLVTEFCGKEISVIRPPKYN
jgi:hypothetical protein